MRKFFISLDRTPERAERFLAANAHVPGFERSPGVDGETVDIEAMREMGLVSDACEFTRAAIGAGLAHVAFWGNVAESGVPAHIFEDDTYLCRNFEQESARVIADLPVDWEIILWGSNHRGMALFELLPGITQCFTIVPQTSVREGIDAFGMMDVTTLPFRLTQTFGTCGYAISPAGARKMIKRCLPLTTVKVPHACLGGRILPATGIDTLMNRHYAEMKSYISFPPLCLTDDEAVGFDA
ncbi:glycosyltransferase family 25 protein [Gluconacetobacter diazotrophicus]|uniref:Glycosyl transferase n=1 Tax=Gluconacetobacter diazotrophicus (strain ATCC 49037 / DSM 5601 / CCUG 37298 / CIP 103539 / LMG 7603 / PAl5) TaxID=272568 RepID=A9HH55_GLUDA|nr:glycosyltransferase family 25 protein [Gluconacetobacter diazotrophicus]CAP55595.1 Glycosyl transferase [Gluconacetobacter diazotrophicus PA1 5]